MRFLLIPLFLMSLSCSYTQAQIVIDTVALGELTIESTRIRKPALDQPVQVTSIDSAQIEMLKGADLGDLLSAYTSLYIRNNGPGAVSVISQRGFGGEQTRVLWEGMPINHQMLGVTDLSLLPSQAFSGVEVTSGSSSSLYGSGISGTVYLKSDAPSSQISLDQTIGSFENYITKGSAAARSGDFTFSIYGSTQNNENNFRYYDVRSQSNEYRERGTFETDQLIGNVKWKRKNIQAKSSVWWNRADHELTENIYAGTGSATQFDESIRWVNNLKIFTDHFLWEARLYAGNTTLDYVDPARNINSLSESREGSAEISATYYQSEQAELNVSFSGTITEVETNNFNGLQSREQLSGGLSATLTPMKKLNLYPAVRLDYYGDFGTALSPSLGLNYSLIEDRLALRGSLARNFRAPTFNDLYWPQGGNENLKAERGFKSEIGLAQEQKGLINFTQELSLYFIQLDEGIKWLPDLNGDFRAQNIQEITSQGAEWSANASTQIAKLGLGFRQSLAYTRAFISGERFSGDQAKGNQLPYVPYWKYNGAFLLSYSGFSTSLHGVYVDDRFTTEQANEFTAADSYLVFDASLNYSKTISETKLSVTAKVNNIFNERYNIVRFYPMPLRNFLINLSITQKF